MRREKEACESGYDWTEERVSARMVETVASHWEWENLQLVQLHVLLGNS